MKYRGVFTSRFYLKIKYVSPKVKGATKPHIASLPSTPFSLIENLISSKGFSVGYILVPKPGALSFHTKKMFLLYQVQYTPISILRDHPGRRSIPVSRL